MLPCGTVFLWLPLSGRLVGHFLWKEHKLCSSLSGSCLKKALFISIVSGKTIHISSVMLCKQQKPFRAMLYCDYVSKPENQLF